MNLVWRSHGPEGLLIRAAEASDADDTWECMDQPGVVAGTLQLPLRSRAMRATWLSGDGTDAHNHPLVAVLGGRVVGNAGLHLASSPRRRHSGAIGMMVHDEFQGQGIGSALIAALLDLADNWLNLRRVELEVFTDNSPGIALYHKFGFTIEGTLRDYAFQRGRFVDAHVMSRLRVPEARLDSGGASLGSTARA